MVTLSGMFDSATKGRFDEIDFIKGLAVISVILLHTIPPYILLKIFAPFHIWHAVPVFMVIAGINSALSSLKEEEFVLLKEYSPKKIKKSFIRILMPFTVVWLVEILALVITGKATYAKVITSYFLGGMGPGSYFTPIYVQHLIFFPVILLIVIKCDKINPYLTLALFCVLALMVEFACVVLNVPESLYRLLYVRYFFATVLGAYLVRHNFKFNQIAVMALLSVIYIGITSYVEYSPGIIYPAWGFQHAPAYFFTIFVVILLWKVFPYITYIGTLLTKIGKASYHIFLIQMVYFWAFSQFVRNIFQNNCIFLFVNLFACLAIGYLFFCLQQRGVEIVSRIGVNQGC
jgi:peptidoglycan/LPS O-acetylase OafA/YrhL